MIACDGKPLRQEWDKIQEKIQATCNKWYNRTFSMFENFLVINTLMGSLFVYKATTMVEYLKMLFNWWKINLGNLYGEVNTQR